MPIRAEDRWLYPIDWQQISAAIRFGRAGARCEQCRRPHLTHIAHLGDGRWWDSTARYWRNGRGRRVIVRGYLLAAVRTTYVVLACAHLNHDPADSTPRNLRALCQRCHILHDAAEHRWRRWWNAFKLRALRDLYEHPRLTHGRIDASIAIGRARFRQAGGEAGQRPRPVVPVAADHDNMIEGLFDPQT